MVNQASTEQAIRQQSIANADSREGVTSLLRQAGLDAAADRLDDLQELIEEDPEEPEMSLDSLRQLALFLMEERQLPSPDISISPEGIMGISWRIPVKGIVAMEFLLSGLIMFAGTCGQGGSENERIVVNGKLPRAETLQALKPFTDRIKTV